VYKHDEAKRSQPDTLRHECLCLFSNSDSSIWFLVTTNCTVHS